MNMTLEALKAAHAFIGEYRERVMRGQIAGNLLQGDYDIWKGLEKAIETESAMQSDHAEPSCGVCGSRMVMIRGRFPGTDRRSVCPTCATELLEDINRISDPANRRNYQGTQGLVQPIK